MAKKHLKNSKPKKAVLQEKLLELQKIANQIIDVYYKPNNLSWANIQDVHRMIDEQIKLNLFRMDCNQIFNPKKDDQSEPNDNTPEAR